MEYASGPASGQGRSSRGGGRDRRFSLNGRRGIDSASRCSCRVCGQVQGRTKKVVFSLVATFVPLILIAIAWELVLRWMEPPLPRSTGEIVRASTDADKQYELIPGGRGTLVGAAVAINSFGCRDREYPLERARGIVRIVGIGDSLTF